MIDSIKQLLQQEAQAVLNIPVTDAYEKAVQLIVEQIHQKKGKLVTSGMGKAGQIAMNIATTFCSTGIPSVFLHPSEAQHGDLGILQKNDLLLLISNSGKTREIVELTRLAHNLDPELKFIVITGNPDSPLAHESDVCLSTGKPAEVCTLGMTPTTSTTAMTVIGDILVVQTMKETGFTIAEYDWLMALVCSLIIAVVTLCICLGGLVLGRKFGTRLAGRAQILGGAILIFIGLEIFISSFLS